MSLKQKIYNAIERVADAEKITRKDMVFLSRDGLQYVWETCDIDAINRFIKVLTPVNRKVAILFFQTFLPHDVEKDNEGTFVRFGKMHKGQKAIAKKKEATAEFLAEPENNIWTWGEDNIEIKKKDFVAGIQRAIASALKGDDKSDTPPLSEADIMAAVMSSGISVQAILDNAEHVMQAQAEAVKVVSEPAQLADA